MPFGHNLFTCSKCGKPFIWGGCIDFVCPDCIYEEHLKKKKDDSHLKYKEYLRLCPDWRIEDYLDRQEVSYYLKDYKTSWGSN